MLNKLLPTDIYSVLSTKLNLAFLNEIRLRINSPIIISYAGKKLYLTTDGASQNCSSAILADDRLINSVVFRATENSIYSKNEQIKEGFITTDGGIRLGVCGEMVSLDNNITTIKNFSSINIRVPCEVKNCSLPILKYVLSHKGGVLNTLIISPPGAGKTTMLRDLCKNISETLPNKNLLVIDERYEICAMTNGKPMLNVGHTIDCLSGTTKEFGLKEGVRVMNPDVIFCDELASVDDCLAVFKAINSGVNVIATAHAKNLNELRNKKEFEHLLNGAIERFIVLSTDNGVGTIDSIFGSKFECLYCK